MSESQTNALLLGVLEAFTRVTREAQWEPSAADPASLFLDVLRDLTDDDKKDEILSHVREAFAAHALGEPDPEAPVEQPVPGRPGLTLVSKPAPPAPPPSRPAHKTQRPMEAPAPALREGWGRIFLPQEGAVQLVWVGPAKGYRLHAHRGELSVEIDGRSVARLEPGQSVDVSGERILVVSMAMNTLAEFKAVDDA